MNRERRKRRQEREAEDLRRRRILLQIYTEHAPWMLRYIRSFSLDSRDAEDALVQCFAQLTGKEDILLQLEETQLLAYLARAARNTALNVIRREKRQRPADWVSLDSIPEDLTPAGEDPFPLSDLWVTILRAVQDFPEREREAVLLRYRYEMSMEEIAETMGVTQNTARGYLHRANLKLRRILREREEQ